MCVTPVERLIVASSMSIYGEGRYIDGDNTIHDDVTCTVDHCFADISRTRHLLGYQPQITLEAGIRELAEWLMTQSASNHMDQMNRELMIRGLTV